MASIAILSSPFQCQSAALDELFGNPASCCRRYQTAHILFHSLAQQVTQHGDKTILNKCKLIGLELLSGLLLSYLIHVFVLFTRSRSRGEAFVCAPAEGLRPRLWYFVTCQRFYTFLISHLSQLGRPCEENKLSQTREMKEAIDFISDEK